MLVKYKTAALLMIIVMACASAALAVPAQINKLELSRDGSFTVLTIGGDNQLKFAHQSIEAKNGKPFRIVIDCLASRHYLSRNVYEDLPKSVIQSIRTSQYAVTPEEVVRIVMDLTEQSVYRVEAGDNCVKVYVSDSKTVPFGNWSSRSEKLVPSNIAHKPTTATSNPKAKPSSVAMKESSAPATTTAKKPAVPSVTTKPSTTNSRLKSEPAPMAKQETTPSTTKVDQKPAVPSMAQKPSVVKHDNKNKNASPYVAKPLSLDKNAKYGPVVATTGNKPVNSPKGEQSQAQSTPVKVNTESAKAPSKNTMPSTTVASKSAKTSPLTQKQTKINKDLVGDTIAKAKAFASLDSKSSEVIDPGMNTAKSKADSKDVHKETPVPSTREKTGVGTTAVPSTAATDNNPALASVDKSDQNPAAPGTDSDEEASKIKTSKYRRESAKSAELKASQVVQFPQRMVIKYHAGSSRDPFETLISADRKKGNVDINSVPNIETLDLVGILKPIAGRGAALMEDLDGIGYILRTGDRVRNGYVAQINNQAVYFQLNEYGWGRTVVKYMEKEN